MIVAAYCQETATSKKNQAKQNTSQKSQEAEKPRKQKSQKPQKPQKPRSQTGKYETTKKISPPLQIVHDDIRLHLPL